MSKKKAELVVFLTKISNNLERLATLGQGTESMHVVDLQRNWILELKNNGDKALEYVYKEYRNPCVSWLQSQFHLEQSEALDIFQESVITCLDNIRLNKVTDAEASLKSYLYGIARLKALQEVRKSKKRTEGELTYNRTLEERDAGSEDPILDKYALLKNLINEMGDPCKTLLDLFYYHRLNLESIKSKMNYATANTVKTKKYKCIKRLQSSFYNLQ